MLENVLVRGYHLKGEEGARPLKTGKTGKEKMRSYPQIG